MSHIRHYGVLLWNEVTVDWPSVGTWSGIFSAFGVRMQVRGLVHPLFVSQTTWLEIPDVCNAKGEWAEHVIEDHEVRDGNDV